mgnify:FL=1
MAKIQFDAFVEDVKTDREGVPFVVKTAETHSRKNDDGTYKTVARTFRDVKVSRDSPANLHGLGKGDRISVTGTEKTEAREHEGKTYYSLVVWADEITRGGQRQDAPAADTWTQPAQAPAASWDTAQVGGAASYGDAEPF